MYHQDTKSHAGDPKQVYKHHPSMDTIHVSNQTRNDHPLLQVLRPVQAGCT